MHFLRKIKKYIFSPLKMSFFCALILHILLLNNFFGEVLLSKPDPVEEKITFKMINNKEEKYFKNNLKQKVEAKEKVEKKPIKKKQEPSFKKKKENKKYPAAKNNIKEKEKEPKKPKDKEQKPEVKEKKQKSKVKKTTTKTITDNSNKKEVKEIEKNKEEKVEKKKKSEPEKSMTPDEKKVIPEPNENVSKTIVSPIKRLEDKKYPEFKDKPDEIDDKEPDNVKVNKDTVKENKVTKKEKKPKVKSEAKQIKKQKVVKPDTEIKEKIVKPPVNKVIKEKNYPDITNNQGKSQKPDKKKNETHQKTNPLLKQIQAKYTYMQSKKDHKTTINKNKRNIKNNKDELNINKVKSTKAEDRQSEPKGLGGSNNQKDKKTARNPEDNNGDNKGFEKNKEKDDKKSEAANKEKSINTNSKVVDFTEGKSMDGVIPPGVASAGKTIYPEDLREREIEGKVILQLLLNKKGKVKEIEIHKSSGYKQFDRAAKNAASNWEFTSAKKDGKKIMARILVPVRFKLD